MFNLGQAQSVGAAFLPSPAPSPRPAPQPTPLPVVNDYDVLAWSGRTLDEARAWAWRARRAQDSAESTGRVVGGLAALGVCLWLARGNKLPTVKVNGKQ